MCQFILIAQQIRAASPIGSMLATLRQVLHSENLSKSSGASLVLEQVVYAVIKRSRQQCA